MSDAHTCGNSGLSNFIGIIISEFLCESRLRKGSFRITDLGPLWNLTQQNMEVLMAERTNLVFHNKVIDGTAMKRLISRLRAREQGRSDGGASEDYFSLFI